MLNLPLGDMPSLLVSLLRSLHDTLTIHCPVQWRCILLVSDWLKYDSAHYWWWGHVTCTRWLMAVGLLMQCMEKRLYVPWELFDSSEIQQMLVELEKTVIKKMWRHDNTYSHVLKRAKNHYWWSVGTKWMDANQDKSRFKKTKKQNDTQVFWPVLLKKYGDWQFWEYTSWLYFIT